MSVIWLFLVAADLRAQAALCRFDGETLLVRTFHVPYVPATGVNPNAPREEPRENQLRFRPEDVRVFRMDGTTIEQAKWQAALAKETAVMFTGHALKGPEAPAAAAAKVALPAMETQLYREDLLIVGGARKPVSQKPVAPGADFPKGSPPRFGMASLKQNDRLQVVESSQSHMHYPPRRDGDNRVETHIFKKSVTTVTTEVRLADATLAFADGTKIPASSAAKALGEETPVLVSADGMPVHPFFLRLFRPRTVVVAIPQPTFGPK